MSISSFYSATLLEDFNFEFLSCRSTYVLSGQYKLNRLISTKHHSFLSHRCLKLAFSKNKDAVSLNDNTILTVSYKSNDDKNIFIINGSFFDDNMNECLEVKVERTFKDFEKLQKDIVNRIGWKIPLLPPESTVVNKPDGNLALEKYLALLLETEVKDETIRLRELNKFLEITSRTRQNEEIEQIKTYKAEIVSDDEFERETDDDDDDRKEDKKMDSAKAGALAGLILGGIPGALVGGLVGGAAASREDTIGDVARTAGKATSVAAKRLEDLNQRYRITETAADSLKKGFQKFKKVIDELDEDLSSEEKPFPDPDDDKTKKKMK